MPSPQQRRALLRSLLKKKYGSNVSSGGVSNPLTLPYVFDFDAETTDATPSWVENVGTDTAVVKEESIEGHSKHLLLPGTNGAAVDITMDGGKQIDATAGIRVQVLGHRSALYAPKMVYFIPYGDGANNLVLAEVVESSTNCQLRSLVRKDGTTWDTGQALQGHQLNGTGNAWTYWRFEFDPITSDQMWFDSYNITGGSHAGYPEMISHATGWEFPTVGLNRVHFVSASYYATKIAEVWIGSMSDAWPTAGEPQS